MPAKRRRSVPQAINLLKKVTIYYTTSVKRNETMGNNKRLIPNGEIHFIDLDFSKKYSQCPKLILKIFPSGRTFIF